MSFTGPFSFYIPFNEGLTLKGVKMLFMFLFFVGVFIGCGIQEYRKWKLEKRKEELEREIHDLELINSILDRIEQSLRESIKQGEELETMVLDGEQFLKERGIEVDYEID